MAIKYRPEIDGLRAVSVIAVLMFHAGFSTFSGGYAGVDVFFVISGYLIASIILNELSSNRFSIVGFYERRARRILPALSIVIFSCLPFAYFWMLPDAYTFFLESVAGSSVFFSNAVFWLNADYFDPVAEEQPLLHTWSLGVEEQFYILFPLLLMLLFKRAGLLKLTVFLLMALSLGFAEFMWRVNSSFNFYMLPSRVWELMAGSLVAILNINSRFKLSILASSVLSMFGLMLVAASVFLFDSATPFPSVYTIIPVIGALLVICFSSEKDLCGRILSSKPFVYVGLISYSLYLWHQPLLAFLKIRSIGDPGMLEKSICLFVAFLLAILTHRYVEKPFRNVRLFNRKSIFILSGFSIGFFLLASVGGMMLNKKQSRYSEEILYLSESSNFNNPDLARCRGKSVETSCVIGNESGVGVVVWGDSHLDQLMPMFSDLGQELGFYVREFAFPGCLPVPFIKRTDAPWVNCDENAKALDFIRANENIKIVVLHAYWYWYVDQHNSYHDTHTIEYMVDAMLKELVENGKKVVIIGPVPKMNLDPRIAMAKSLYFGSEIELGIPFDRHFDDTSRSRAMLIQTINNTDQVIYVDPSDVLCPNGFCSAYVGNKLLYRDDNHLSVQGGFILRSALKSVLVNLIPDADAAWTQE